MNENLIRNVLQAALDCGVRDIIFCPGARNVGFTDFLRQEKRVSTYYWPEERSGAFFALGLSRQMKRPTAIIVTSGSAVAELLPAAMEAYYSGVPLLLITADRPRRFRGSGAPSAAEQVGLFGPYVHFFIDVHGEHTCDLRDWVQNGPAHVNVCLEEPQGQPPFSGKQLTLKPCETREWRFDQERCATTVDRFLQTIQKPLVIVSTLVPHQKAEVVQFLLKLNAPVYLEGISGLREETLLEPLRIRNTEKMLKSAENAGYSIDGVLRIGGVPTNRVWRDIENLKNQIKVCSISELPFSGLSWNRNVACVRIDSFLKAYQPSKRYDMSTVEQWIAVDKQFEQDLLELFAEEPYSEPAVMHSLSKLIPDQSHVYLGNSLPIREWDMAADFRDRKLEITASRGVNGIDGQVATFLGLCQPERENWAILGDLTTIYDMAGFWILPQLEAASATVAIINNGGGKIFERLFPHKENLNCHSLHFEPLAKMWGLSYDRWDKDKPFPKSFKKGKRQMIELIPDEESTARFWKKVAKLGLVERLKVSG